MTTYQSANALVSFVDENIFLPNDAAQLRVKLTDSMREYAIAINTRSIGYYDQQERVTGNLLYNPVVLQNLRPGFRKTIDFGPLPASTIISVPHGISINSNFQFFKIFGTATNPAATGTMPFAIPLSYTITGDLQLYVTLTNVVINTTQDYSAYTDCTVILEYIKF